MKSKIGSARGRLSSLQAGGWLILPFIVGLLSFFVLAPSIRPIADDFCQIADAKTQGIFNAVSGTYQMWSGRYSAYLLMGIMGEVGIWTLNVLPVMLIIGYVVGFFVLFKQWAQIFRVLSPSVTALYLATGVTFVWVNIVGMQAIFWAAGAASYGVPVLILLWLTNFLIHAIRHRWHGWCLLGATFTCFFVGIAGAGFSEMYIVMQGSVLGLFVLMLQFILPKDCRRTGYFVVGASSLGLGIGAYIVMTAPGNDVRVAAAIGLRRIPLISFMQIALSGTVVISFVDGFRFAGILTCFIGTLAFFIWHYRDNPHSLDQRLLPVNLWLVFILLHSFALGVVFVSVALPLYGVGVLAPRVAIFIHLVHMLWMVVSAYLTFVWMVRKNYLRVLVNSPMFKPVAYSVAILLIAYPALTVIRNIGLNDSFARYARSWDERDTEIRRLAEQGELFIEVTPLVYNIEDYLFLEKAEAESNFVNHCIADYYAVESVTIVDE